MTTQHTPTYDELTTIVDMQRGIVENREATERNLRTRVAELEAALRECAIEREYNPEALRDVARRFADNAPIVGRDKEFAAMVLGDFSRAIRVARAALAKGAK